MLTLSTQFSAALVFASVLHRRQVRKVSGTPYLGHLLAVAGIALAYGADENEAIAALLHDAVEDQGGQATYRAIRDRFGDTVAQIVLECSDTDTQPKPPWRQRKEADLERLTRAAAPVRLVKAADKLDNCRALVHEYRTRGESLWAHFHGGRAGTLWYFRASLEVLRRFGPHPLVEELDRAVTELERLTGPQTP